MGHEQDRTFRCTKNGRPARGRPFFVCAQPGGIIPGALAGSTGTPTPTGGRPGAPSGAGGAFGSAGAALGSAGCGAAYGSGSGGGGGDHGRMELARVAAAALSTGLVAVPSQTTNQ